MSHQAQEEAMTQTASDLKERSQHSLSVFCARHPKLAERIRRSIFVEMNDSQEIVFWDTESANRIRSKAVLTAVSAVTGNFIRHIIVPDRTQTAIWLALRSECIWTDAPADEDARILAVVGITNSLCVPIPCHSGSDECENDQVSFQRLDGDGDYVFFWCDDCENDFWLSASTVADLLNFPSPYQTLYCERCGGNTEHNAVGQKCIRHSQWLYRCYDCDSLREEH